MSCEPCLWVEGKTLCRKGVEDHCPGFGWYGPGSSKRVFGPDVEKLESGTFQSSYVEKVAFNALLTVPQNAFSSCKYLVNVILDVATIIEQFAFVNCTALEYVRLPSAKEIGHDAFRGCTQLTEMDIPNCEKLGSRCFYDCPMLKTVKGAPKRIGAECCAHCRSLTFFNFKECLSIGEYAFEETSQLQDVSFSTQLLAIGPCSFYNSGLLRVEIDAPQCIVGEGAFKWCIMLQVVHVKVKQVGQLAFFCCRSLLTAIVFFPKDTNSEEWDICDGAFEECARLQWFTSTAKSIAPGCLSNCLELTTCTLSHVTEYGQKCFEGASPEICCWISAKAKPMTPPGQDSPLLWGVSPDKVNGWEPSLVTLGTERSIRTALIKGVYVSRLWSRLPLVFKSWVLTIVASLQRWESHLVHVPTEMVMLILSMLSARNVPLSSI